MRYTQRQEIEYVDFDVFREACKDAKFFVRTAESAPCSNILLISASGTTAHVAKYDIAP